MRMNMRMRNVGMLMWVFIDESLKYVFPNIFSNSFLDSKTHKLLAVPVSY